MHMAVETRHWTIEDLDRLPEDGNAYEVVRGELFVTPPPTDDHETIAARLTRIIDPYVARHDLGYVYRPKAVIQFEDSQVEPDLMVRARGMPRSAWRELPLPILVVEILSPVTHRRDRGPKRQLYDDARIADYWIVDPDARSVTIIRAGSTETRERRQIEWKPAGVSESLLIDVEELFDPPQSVNVI